MKTLRFDRWIARLALVIILTPGLSSAQEPDTLSVSGTFQMHDLQGTVSADLAAVFANGNDHGWTLTLHGVSYSHDYSYSEWDDEWSYGYLEQYITRVHATSFDYQFFGLDADILNAVVSSQLTAGGLTDGACFELLSGYWFNSEDSLNSGPYARWALVLLPLDPAAGVVFSAGGRRDTHFSADEYGYPLVEPQRVWSSPTVIDDRRPGNNGSLRSYNDIVDIGSSAPPALPPTISIADASAPEGDRGTSRLNLVVSLSTISGNVVTVNYATASGSALASNKDYTPTSGILTFQAGEMRRTISVSIKGDRTREPDETFSVRLAGAVGGTISDGLATATILNDD